MMFGAVQLGLLAACVVLFVPMGMAGWHLSRNKMLFFSCALFITLAVGVHLMPYFPSVSDFLSPTDIITSPTGESSLRRDSCLFFLHSGVYSADDECENDNGCKKRSWEWIQSGKVAECQFQRLKKLDASILLNGSWVVVAGDSQARLMVVSLLELVMGSEEMERVRGDLFKRHTDYSVVVDEIALKLDFLWAPYVRNLTELMVRFKGNNNYPDVVVMGAGLWDMLHLNNVSDYGVSLTQFKDSCLALMPVSSDLDAIDGGLSQAPSNQLVHFFWLGIPTLINSILNTAEKRERMTDTVCDLYNNKLIESELLRQSGGPLLNLDIRLLSELCGPQCTVDGMHYDQLVYDAAVQIMLNALLIESNQKLQ
ncbi:protein ALTERED XYLOGLUCAN 9-like [Primulina eburnea]|uniref:protein ALTERED XYLOGLUCAN 9-like n=1 Tax=Primulina eburnea TaxID=1245227 RepID=UPI003C6BD8E3